MLFDLFVHRDLPFAEPPEVHLLSRLHGRLGIPLSRQERYLLPCREPVRELGSGPPVVATPLVPRYAEMLRDASERLGWPLEEFRGYRFVLSYPPIPTIPVLHYPLASPPGADR